MVTRIDKPIRVGVVFEPQGRLRPLWFVWQGRRHIIRQVTYTWGQREGIDLVQNFAVTDGANLYQISYSRDAMAWRLVAVEDGG